MRRLVFSIQCVGVAILILGLVVIHPVHGSPLVLHAQEVTPRPTPTPAPYLRVSPSEGVAGAATRVSVMGELWNPGPVAIYWDNAGGALVGQPTAGPDGVFAFEFTTPTDGSAAAPGGHMVIAVQGSSRGEAGFYLSAAPPTDTSTPTATPTPSRTWTPTLTPSPVTPSATPSRTPTLTPSPTFRAMTPMVTITPIPPTRRPPGSVATRTPTPTETGTPTPTQTPTPSPEPPTATVTPSVTATPSNTPGLATFEPTSSPEPVVDTVAPPTEVQSTTVALARTREVTGTVSIEGAGTTSEPEEGGTGLASTRNLAVMSILLLMGGGAFGAMVTATGVGLWMRRRKI